MKFRWLSFVLNWLEILGIIDVVNAYILWTHGLITYDSGDGTNTEEEDQLDDDVEGFDFAKLKYVVLFEWRFTVLVYDLFMWNRKFCLFYFWWNTEYLIAWKKTKFNKCHKTTTTFNDDWSTVHSYVVKQWLLAFVSRELYPEQKADLKKLRNHLISSSSELAALKVWELQGNCPLFLLIKTIKVP